MRERLLRGGRGVGVADGVGCLVTPHTLYPTIAYW